MSSVDVHVFRESVAKIVRALTDSNIKVRQEGMKAYVQYDAKGCPDCVTLPSIPDNAPADLLNAIQGFLDHEVSHVLHTDFPFAAKRQMECKRNRDTLRPILWNVVEDIFIERAMSARFTGSMVNIDNIQRYLTGKMLPEGYNEMKRKGASEANVRSYLLPAALRAAAGQLPFVEFMKDKWSDMGYTEEGIKKLGSKMAKIKSTRESWDLVEELHAVIKPKDESEGGGEGDGDGKGKSSKDPKSKDNKSKDKDESGEEDGSESSKGGDDDKSDESESSDEGESGSDGSGDDSDSEDEGEDEESEKNGDKPNSETDEGDESSGSDSEDSDDEADGDEPDLEDGDGDSDGHEKGDGKGDETSDPDTEQGEAPPKIASLDEREESEGAPTGGDALDATFEEKDIEDLINPELVKSLDEMGAELIEQEVKEHMRLNPSDYVPFTRDYDYVGSLPAAEKYQDLSLDDSAVATLAHETAHVIQGEVERIFRARSATRWNPGQRRGKISRNSLHRACIGDDRVFRQKIVTTNREIAVQLVIDCSGSMWGRKLEYASVAAYMLASVLDRINVPCEIVGFTTMNGAVAGHLSNTDWRALQKHFHASWGEMNYGRYAPTCLYVFKDFARRFDDKAKKTLGFLPSSHGFMSGNVDGESIEQSAMRMRLRKEPRKVMIVMSDGQPACDGDFVLGQRKLKQVVEDINASGIEIYGLGLMDNSVKNYYPKNEVIGTANEIPTKVLALIQQLLVS